MKCTVKLVWDSEAAIWYTETEDVPGLVLHAPSFDELVEKVRLESPDLLEENVNYPPPVEAGACNCPVVRTALASHI